MTNHLPDARRFGDLFSSWPFPGEGLKETSFLVLKPANKRNHEIQPHDIYASPPIRIYQLHSRWKNNAHVVSQVLLYIELVLDFWSINTIPLLNHFTSFAVSVSWTWSNGPMDVGVREDPDFHVNLGTLGPWREGCSNYQGNGRQFMLSIKQGMHGQKRSFWLCIILVSSGFHRLEANKKDPTWS